MRKRLSVFSMKRSVPVLSGVVMIAAWLMILPSVGAAYTNFVMTSFQGESNPQYLSGQINYLYSGTVQTTGSNGTPSYGFCANNSAADLYLGSWYYGTPVSIQGNPGYLEAAYLMATNDSGGNVDVNGGIVLQTAIWDVTGQSYTNYYNLYLSNPTQYAQYAQYQGVYTAAGNLASAAQAAYNSDSNHLASYANLYGLLQLYANSDLSGENQDLATVVPLGTETPIPGAILLLAPGLVGLAAVRKKFKI
jgi:hypothetical protein